MKKYKLVIFDLDGTLVDTSKGILECHKYTNITMGRPEPSDKELEGIIGGPLLEIYQQRFNFSDYDARKAVEIYRTKYAEKGIYGASIYEHIPETLNVLKNNGFRLAVATLKADVLAKKLLSNLNISNCFDVIHGVDQADTVTKSDLIEFCVNDIGVSKNESVLIGDSIYDAVGAEKAGIDFIAVTYGFGTIAEFIEANTVLTIDNPSDLIKILSE